MYDGHRWIPEPDEAVRERIGDRDLQESRCPGCTRVARKQVDGVVTLEGGFMSAHSDEIKNVISRVAKNRRGRNVNSRVLRMSEDNGRMTIETTDEHLAERIGKEVQKAFKGDLEIQWQEKDNFVRVNWRRD